MDDKLVIIGAGCIIAAIVGGGLKITNLFEIPGFTSYRRQLLLGAFGVVLMLAASHPSLPSRSVDLAGTWQGVGAGDVADVKRHFQYVYFPPQNMAFRFTPDGNTLQGTMTLRKDDRFYTSTDLEYGLLEGKVDGERISFEVHSDFAVNDQPKIAIERFVGHVHGDQIDFTVQEDTGFPPLQFAAARSQR